MGQEKLYDVVIVGTGNAALSSAISAGEEGLKVLLIEKGAKNERGGNSFFTDGAIRCSYESIKNIQSVIPSLTEDDMKNINIPEYNNDNFYEDILRVTKSEGDLSLAKKLADESFSTIKWLFKQGVKFELNENQYFEQNGKKTFWGGLPLKTENKGIGLIESLFKRVEELEIETLYSTKAIKINMSEEKVKSITIENEKDKQEIFTRAVILACGGFESSKSKRKHYLGSEWGNAIVRGTRHNTGDGIDMALSVGAQKYGQWDGCHAHTTDYNAPKTGDFNKPGDIYKKSSYPLGLIVNNNGERFVDEGADFRNYTYAKYGKETLRQPNQLAYQLYDSQVYPNLRKEYKLEEATMIKASTIEELALKMQINPEKFKTTIQEYNQSVQDGNYNPSIKDGKKTVGITPPKSNWSLKFEKAPFYAYPVTCGITFTFGAVKVNSSAEVLNKHNLPIKGLYAAGEMVGGLFYHNYPGGSGLMSGAVFGKQAGKTATKYVNSPSS